MGIAFENVSFAYPDKPVLTRFSYALPDTGAVCLTGPSGCGKTTLLRLLAGLEIQTEGTVRGVPQRLSVVFQEDRLLPWATVEENVSLVLDTPDAAEIAAGWLDTVGLGEVRDQLPHALSGGMQRRVALARAFAADGDLWLLDEPFTGLDRALAQSMAAIVHKAAQQKPVVLVTHTREEADWIGAQVLDLTETGNFL